MAEDPIGIDQVLIRPDVRKQKMAEVVNRPAVGQNETICHAAMVQGTSKDKTGMGWHDGRENERAKKAEYRQ